METIHVNRPNPFGEHTATIQLNRWAVVNAPRPIPGAITWQGEFRHGIFYAAGNRADFGERWNDLDAWPVEAITNLDVTERIAAMARERGTTLAEVLDDFDGDMSELAKACNLPWFTE